MASERPLSQVPPDEFVEARNALARRLRESGKTEEAKRIAALRRPSTPLWIVNQLGPQAPAAVEALIEATQRARRAQVHPGARDELHGAMHAQRQALHELLSAAEKAASGIGTRITPEIQRRIQDTVQTAAAAEPKALREGTLEQELSAAGFGALLSGPAATVAKAEARQTVFRKRAAEQKEKVAERREQILHRRDLQRAEQAARHLEGRAEQQERVAARLRENADKAEGKAREARGVADAAAARLLQLRQTDG
jgi:hypothetical protein